jgi:hypothetical protein
MYLDGGVLHLHKVHFYLNGGVEVQSSGAVPLKLLSEDAVVELAAVLVGQQQVDVEVGRAPVGEGTVVVTTTVIAASVVAASVITTFCATSVGGPVADLEIIASLTPGWSCGLRSRLRNHRPWA